MPSRIAVEAIWAERAAAAGMTVEDVVDAALADVAAELHLAAAATEVRDA